MLYLNRLEYGELVEKTWAVGTCAYHLTGYGKGVSQDDVRAIADMQRAWRFTFGPDIPAPAYCEVHEDPTK